MTHQPLTKAEREELQNRHRFQSDPDSRDINRLLADLDAAEADVVSMRNEGEEMAGQVMQRFAELEAQRDRAESELDAERRMRVEAEAASDRLMAERDALIRNINDAFLSLNIPNSTMAFDGRNLLPHAVESARYAEEMRIERDKALADVAKYVDRSESFASAIDHLVSNTADGTDLARITKERDDFRDGMVAMLVAAGAPVDLDAMEAAVLSAGKKPSDFISQRIRVLTAERDALWVDHRDVVDERDALKAKLVALVKAADPFACDQGCDAVHHPFKDRHDQRESCPVVARLRAAIAAARGGAS